MTEQWNCRVLTEQGVEACRCRGIQASPYPEPNVTVWSPPRGNPTVQVIILPRKPAKHPILQTPVPQTDTGSRVEHTKALRESRLRN